MLCVQSRTWCYNTTFSHEIPSPRNSYRFVIAHGWNKLPLRMGKEYVKSCRSYIKTCTHIETLAASCDEPFYKFVHTRDKLSPDKESENLIFAKGIFPYDYFSSLAKFEDTCLPPKDSVYSHLREEGSSDEEFDRAQAILTTFNCQTFKDYHDLYLKRFCCFLTCFRTSASMHTIVMALIQHVILQCAYNLSAEMLVSNTQISNWN